MAFSIKQHWISPGIFLVLIGLLFGTSCFSDPTTFHETNPLPDFKNDLAFFMGIGCTLESGGILTCKDPSALTSSGCSTFHTPSPYLGGLNPAYPMIECSGPDYSSEGNDSVRLIACPYAPFYQYAITLSGSYLAFLKDIDDFKTMFAPVETPEEALSFAIALTGDYPLFDLIFPTDVKLSIDPSDFQLTYAEETEGGYKVLLFSDKGCGCYYNTLLTANEYLVTPEGDVTLTNSYEIYHGADEGMICVD